MTEQKGKRRLKTDKKLVRPTVRWDEKNQKQMPLSPGRPPLEEQTKMTEEMEEFAWNLRTGFTPEEAAGRMSIPVDRALRMYENPLVHERVNVLFGNKLKQWAVMRDELYEVCLRTSIKLVKAQKVPWSYLDKIMTKLEVQQSGATGNQQPPTIPEKSGVQLPEDSGDDMNLDEIFGSLTEEDD